MKAKKRGLGRGLDALLGGVDVSADGDDSTMQKLAIELLQRGKYQPRREMDAERLQELADSISAQGLVQPIVVRKIAREKYEIIAGERRWRAAQLAGLSEVPVVIRDVPDQAAMAMSLVENIQREDLNPLEEAEALQRLLKEFKMTHQQVADAVGKSRTTVTNLLRLLELEAEVKSLLDKARLEMGHARALLALSGEEQCQAARKVAQKNMTVRATEKLVRELLSGEPAHPKSTKMDPDIIQLQEELSGKLGAKTIIKHNVKGNGKIVVEYSSLDELEGLLEHIH
ncbi:MAG: chromosome partitioning protein ParB [Gammaproteobacteria bacterium]|nr:MAG: chromosome partitioning protein ParB [Gammaproteobacteria bacterium]